MFGRLANTLTEYSGYYLDWSRFSIFLRNRNHHYTKEQLAVRGLMIACAGISGFLGAHYNDPQKTNCSNVTIALASGTLGLFFSHAIALNPLIKKRYDLSRDCHQLTAQIHKKLERKNIKFQQKVEALVDTIQGISLSDDKMSRATQTLARRKNLLTNLDAKLSSRSNHTKFWKEKPDTIIQKLSVSSLRPGK